MTTGYEQHSGDVKDTALSGAAETKDVAMQRGGDTVAVAKDELAQLAHEARGHAYNLWSQTSDQLREHAQAGTHQFADVLHSLSGELGQMASKSEQNGPVTALARQLSARGGSLSHWLSNSDVDDVLREVRRFARRRPFAFLVGAATAGVLAGRLSRGLMGGQDSSVNTGPQVGGSARHAVPGQPTGMTTPVAAPAVPVAPGVPMTEPLAAPGWSDTMPGAAPMVPGAAPTTPLSHVNPSQAGYEDDLLMPDEGSEPR